jgi:hypothetical protein
LFSSFYLAKHNEGLLYPGEDPEGDVGGPALAEGVPVRDIQPQGRGPLTNLYKKKILAGRDMNF